MTKETISSRAARLIGSRVYGPFREAGGLPGETSRMRLDAAARAYLWNRRVRNMGAQAALEAALPVALRPHTDRAARLWYGPRGGAGAPFKAGSDVMRWLEDTAAAGLRFVGWADDLPGGPNHFGWFTRADSDMDSEMLRGGVWQLPGRNGEARLVYGYAEFETRNQETNPGSAAVCVSDIVRQPMRDQFGNLDETEGARDAARWADGLAESQAEQSRDYDESYQAGRAAAEIDAELVETRRELLPLMAELRAERKRAARTLGASPPEAARPAICAALQSKVESMLETISEARTKLAEAWAACPSWAEEAWRAGFMDESGFARAVRLGFASRDDWKGKPEDCPV